MNDNLDHVFIDVRVGGEPFWSYTCECVIVAKKWHANLQTHVY